MRRILFVALWILAQVSAFAQTIIGTVKDDKGAALEGASVVAATDDSHTVAYCITGSKGDFRLVIPEGKVPSTLNVNYMGYEKVILPFAEVKDGMTITMKEGGFKLKEVKVKSQRITSSNDTLTYSVAGFKQGQDRSIADVIAKMPGVEVKKDGTIEYQGKPINKFYIEGLDLMGSQYGVANKNISADKVESVQVLQNHEPVKSLRGVSFSDQAAINLVLKEEAKSVWAGTADVGLGYGKELLYDCRVLGMRFNKTFQTLMMYKNNDTGKSIDDEVLDLASLRHTRWDDEDGIVSMLSTGSTDLQQNRYKFNHSHLAAGNWLWKTGKESELRLQGSGFIDRTNMNHTSSTTYLTIAEKPVILEEEEVTNSRSEWKGEVNYQFNGSNTFVRNNLKGLMHFNKSIGSTLHNGQITEMMVKPHKVKLTEHFQLSHTTARRNVYSLDSYWNYYNLPSQLLTINGMTQKLNLNYLSGENSVKYRIRLGRQYLNNEAGVNYDRQSIEAGIYTTASLGIYQLLRIFWTPSMTFRFSHNTLEVASMVSYAHQSYQQSGGNHLWIDPSAKWSWEASSVSKFSANIQYSNTPLMAKAIYGTPVFTGYYTQTVNRGETGQQHSLQASAGYQYSNPLIGLFFNIRPSYSRSDGNILYQSTLNNDVLTMAATDKDYAMHSTGLYARFSKTFGWAKTMVALSGSHNVSTYSMLVGEEVNDARMNSTTLGFDYSLRPLRQLSIEGRSKMKKYRQQNITNPSLSSGSTIDWEHNMDFHIFLAERWMFSVKNELFHTNEEGVGMNYFCDLAVSYRTKRWELSLNANNIIGTSNFERHILGNTIEHYSIVLLRPREFIVKWSVDL